MMIDENLARLRAHRNNIGRYRRLLQTNLTVLERDFIERRLAEEDAALNSRCVLYLPPRRYSSGHAGARSGLDRHPD